MKRRFPKTDAELREAVDMASACRAIADCKMYGLLEGGPNIDVARCDEILAAGDDRGIHPSRPVTELAVEWVQLSNAGKPSR